MRMPTLLLLPGLDGTGDFFAPLLDAIGTTIPTKVVRYPLTGAGDYATCEAIARAALPTDRPYVLLGESFSGPIAIAIAATAPPGLVGLVLCVTFIRNPLPRLTSLLRPILPALSFHATPASKWFSRWLVLGRWATPEIRTLHQQILERLPAATSRARLEAVADCDVRAELRAVTVPVLCLTARHDRLIPASAGRLIGEHAPAAIKIELSAPHCLLQCEPREAQAAIGSFLQSLSATSPYREP